MIKPVLSRSIKDLQELLPRIAELHSELERLGEALLACWDHRGKVLIAGNGGSAADSMHLAEELCVRFAKNRKALAAMALCDPTVLTCAANDFGFESVFSRQIEAFGNPGDVFIALTTSGNSANLIRAVDAAKTRGLVTVAFLGKNGGKLRGRCDIELLIPSPTTARIQESHKLLYHVLCEWIESKVS
ncbi:MAG TPA: SIS domain-containing protein [Tepidisphaeraceae bacterium]|jgi:D-sedoheptulose 7-phosphate isomerase|nr:SIS domain-containing protein [Tepidisphaeraceae bacterium]